MVVGARRPGTISSRKARPRRENEPTTIREELLSKLSHPTPEGVAAGNGYSHVVTGPGQWVAIAGQAALDADGNFVGAGDPAAQARQVFANLDSCLRAAGATFADVVKLNFYVTDIAHLPAIRTARTSTSTPPPRPPAPRSRSSPCSNPRRCSRSRRTPSSSGPPNAADRPPPGPLRRWPRRPGAGGSHRERPA
ncbi:RidA family protein [Kribbella turkmenica]|uniref:RidA family protein n=1 Tax=Kribbella turkmenica TaxID=2530375 RepID=UPI001F25F95D|nr:RidA family protein [Kribbella turkmenica]